MSDRIVCSTAPGSVEGPGADADVEGSGLRRAQRGPAAAVRDFIETSTPVINGENASVTVPHTLGRAPLIDGSVGIRVGKGFGIGVGYSQFTDTETAMFSAQIPNPIVFNSLRTASASPGEMIHRESAVHVQLLWMMPISDRFDVAAILGPSFIAVTQDLFRGITTIDPAPPFATVTISSIQMERQSKTVPALTIGTDIAYRVTRQLGAGLFLRFSRVSGGNVDLPASGGDGNIGVDAGGLQAGAGLRVRF